jgi:hypothetical protein
MSMSKTSGGDQSVQSTKAARGGLVHAYLVSWAIFGGIAFLVDLVTDKDKRAKLDEFNQSVRTGLDGVSATSMLADFWTRLTESRYDLEFGDLFAPFNRTERERAARDRAKLPAGLADDAASLLSDEYRHALAASRSIGEGPFPLRPDPFQESLEPVPKPPLRNPNWRRLPLVPADHAANVGDKQFWEYLVGIPDALIFMFSNSAKHGWFSQVLAFVTLLLIGLACKDAVNEAKNPVDGAAACALIVVLSVLSVTAVASILRLLLYVISYGFQAITATAASVGVVGSILPLCWFAAGAFEVIKHSFADKFVDRLTGDR